MQGAYNPSVAYRWYAPPVSYYPVTQAMPVWWYPDQRMRQAYQSGGKQSASGGKTAKQAQGAGPAKPVVCMVTPSDPEALEQQGLDGSQRIAVVANSDLDCVAIGGRVKS